ncbi:aldo/keto reductase [Phreatobacter aquaticus]|uniref:Aldo/keto reductase n=1 Tax=Phreatobacter aquaticus TaxID=2570229 RepID=A0A4D7QEH2_9HYPH|nr:aldo/keto reductase [Phreatobacter aquaticus]QCK84941.1 aldo/keto reductase [Phreatobacter aquaticus]
MQHRPLGRTGVSVSAVCLGTMTFGQQNTEAEGHAQMDYAVSRGVTFFDTAEMYAVPPKPETYGATEKIIGSWLKARGKRDDIFLATKIAGAGAMDWMRPDKAPSRLNRQQMTIALEQSLTRLGTDHVDLYQLHWPERPAPFGANPTRFDPTIWADRGDETSIAEQLDVLDGFVKAGKVRFIGLSNESAWGTMSFLKESEIGAKPRVQSVQNAYHLMNRTFETALAEVWMREQVGLLAYSPLAQGFLTGKYLDGARPPGARVTLFNRQQRYEKPGSNEAVKDYLQVAREAGIDGATLAIAFVMSRPFVTSTIIGATSMEQLKIAIDAGETVLSEDVLAKVDAVHQMRGNPAP